jgi:hypothetical protein
MSNLTEKRLKSIAPIAFIADGNQYGKVTISDTYPFKVKQEITIQAVGLPNLILEVKRVETSTLMFVGPKGGSIDTRTDLTLYTVSAGAFIYAVEQHRPVIAIQDIDRAVFSEEPAVAIRTLDVDQYGTPWSEQNPMPVEGTLTVTTGGASLPTIVNTPMPSATEYVITIPLTAKEFVLRMRGNTGIQLGVAAGDTATKFFTVRPGSFYSQDGLKLPANLQLFVRPTRPGDILELLYWI